MGGGLADTNYTGRNLCLPENAEAIDNVRYSVNIEVEVHTRMTVLASILQNLGNLREARHEKSTQSATRAR